MERKRKKTVSGGESSGKRKAGERKEKGVEKVKKEKKVSELEEGKEEKEQKKNTPLLVVTGACGFIGSWAVEIAKNSGWRVRACDLPGAFRGKDEFGRARYPELVRKLADEVVECDITKPETLKGVFEGADYIFHIAAILKYDVPWDVLYNVNVLGTKNVFEEILRSGTTPKRVVVWSTNGIYGVPEPDEIPVREDSPVRPPTRYALSKFLEEKIALMYYREHEIPVTVIRPTAVYGPRESYMFLENLRALKKSKFIAIPSNFNLGFPSVHAVDVVRAAMHLAQIPEAEGEDYIVDDDSGNTAIDIMKFAAEKFEKPFYLLPPVPLELLRGFMITVSFLDEKISHMLGRSPKFEYEFMFMFGYDMRYSNEKLKSTGFEFKYPRFQDGMSETVKWYEEVGLL